MRRVRFVGLGFIVAAILTLTITGFFVCVLWNVLMPAIFGLHTITFWQALGLLVLSRALFGTYGNWGRRAMRRARFVRGWKDLADDEQERFRRGLS